MKVVTKKPSEDESVGNDQKTGSHSKMMLWSIGAALVFWLAEAVLDSAFFQRGSFLDELFFIDLNEAMMRLVSVVLIIAFGLYARASLSKQEHLQNKLADANVKLEERVYRRTVELATANEQLRVDLDKRRILETELERHRDHLEDLLDQRAGQLADANRSLESEVADRREAEEAIRESERQLYKAMQMAGVGSWQVDFNADTFTMSPSLMDIYGMDQDCITIEEGIQQIHPEDRERAKETLKAALRGESAELEYRICRPSGEILTVFSPAAYLVRDSDGKPSKLIGITQDITERRQAEREAIIAGQIMDAKQAALREKNIALRNVVQQVDAEKEQIKTEIKANVERVIMPTLRLLKRKVDVSTGEYVNMLDSSLKDLTSPFINRLETDFAKLSPGELEICDLVRKGLSSKEIADIRDVSVQTISMQRKRIRKKLGIANKGTSLPALLQSITR